MFKLLLAKIYLCMRFRSFNLILPGIHNVCSSAWIWIYVCKNSIRFCCFCIFFLCAVVSVADISEVDIWNLFVTSVYRKSHNTQNPCTMVSFCSVLGHTSAMSAPINICFRFNFQRGPFLPQIDQNYSLSPSGRVAYVYSIVLWDYIYLRFSNEVIYINIIYYMKIQINIKLRLLSVFLGISSLVWSSFMLKIVTEFEC